MRFYLIINAVAAVLTWSFTKIIDCAIAPSDYLLKLRQDSIANQTAVLAEQPSAHLPIYPRHDWEAGAAATLQLMHQGVERISQGVLRASLENGMNLVTRPNLMV